MASTYALEGSAAHEVARVALVEGKDAAAYVGRVIPVTSEPHAKLSASGAHRWIACPGSHALELAVAQDESEDRGEVEVTADMAEAVQVYLDHVRNQVGDDGTLLIEQRVRFGDAIGVQCDDENGFGTADAVVLKGDRIVVIDLKFGRGVKVHAAGNEQLQLYGLGALSDYSAIGDFTTVDLHIVQPRIDHIDTWLVSAEELREFAEKAKAAAVRALTYATKGPEAGELGPSPALTPGDKQCRFCKAKATCPALMGEVSRVVFDDISVLANPHETAAPKPLPADAALLGALMSRIDLVETWCSGVRAEVERRIFAGETVPGYKLVEGKRGNRTWSDEAAVVELLKGFRFKQDEMFDFKLISPAKVEKLLKESPKRWARAAAFVTQSDGKPSVAPESDKRPAIKPGATADDFSDLT